MDQNIFLWKIQNQARGICELGVCRMELEIQYYNLLYLLLVGEGYLLVKGGMGMNSSG